MVDRINLLAEARKSTSKTSIAALGTALLAKATDFRVNPFVLQKLGAFVTRISVS